MGRYHVYLHSEAKLRTYTAHSLQHSLGIHERSDDDDDDDCLRRRIFLSPSLPDGSADDDDDDDGVVYGMVWYSMTHVAGHQPLTNHPSTHPPTMQCSAMQQVRDAVSQRRLRYLVGRVWSGRVFVWVASCVLRLAAWCDAMSVA